MATQVSKHCKQWT